MSTTSAEHMENRNDSAPAPLETAPQIVRREDGATIAYHVSSGKSPGVVFLGGFCSDMNGTKAVALEKWCRATGRAFLRFDYCGHGQSSGDFADGTIGSWASDAVFAIETLTQGPQVLVGSSMGGWIMMLAALSPHSRICALLGLAAAPDFTEDLIHGELTPRQVEVLNHEGLVKIPNCYDAEDPYIITKALIDDGKKQLLLGGPIELDIPVRLIQGMKDADVPWKTALKIQEMLTGEDVEVQLIKNGDHRLSEPADLERLLTTLEKLLGHVEARV